ncbi:SDR family oxidoreductase [Rhodopila sp.]|uniref:SDR family oxidoreductase n=1 Tax=Rhodopila sp. TaxID=2480087 RepID=UPI002B819FDE|nr:SDR family oxidoreductase [Rhodopila sp.]HVZ10287.1 SDR family oxidoreductase [Rhodopila sp.]
MSAGIVVVTGGSAGVGRATVEAFARAGWNVGIIARGQLRLDAAAAEVERMGRRACAVSADVADPEAVERAAEAIERKLGPIDVWVNNAMATVFGPVSALTAEEFRRGTDVTYLGQVHGTMTALKRMRPRNKGVIVNVGSALSHRAIPLQSIYCGAKYAVRGFTDALRSELLHDGVPVHLTMVHLPAINTPQFEWALNKTGFKPQPVPPIFSPDVAARAILFAATHRRREVWVGFSTVKAILAGKLAPGLVDRYLARVGYSGQLTADPAPAHAPGNLFQSVVGAWGAHGRFVNRERQRSLEMMVTRHRGVAGLAVAAVAAGLWCGLLCAARARRTES